jgi:hypothetical protein
MECRVAERIPRRSPLTGHAKDILRDGADAAVVENGGSYAGRDPKVLQRQFPP